VDLKFGSTSKSGRENKMYSVKRLVTSVAILGMFTMPSFAQRQPGAAAHFGANAGNQRTNRLAVLAKALNLTDAQVTSIRNTMQSEQPSLKTMVQDVKAKRQALKAVASAANPNPAAVGNAFLALRSSEANLKAGRQKLQASIRNILTPEQQKSMDALKVVAQARHDRFHRFGGGMMPMGSSGPKI
jgi:Spy/CpxP family protein refolding chaperone